MHNLLRRYIFLFMNVALLRNWIERHEPQGRSKLSVAAGVSVHTITALLRDDHSPSVPIAKKLAKALGVTLDELCDDAEARTA